MIFGKIVSIMTIKKRVIDVTYITKNEISNGIRYILDGPYTGKLVLYVLGVGRAHYHMGEYAQL